MTDAFIHRVRQWPKEKSLDLGPFEEFKAFLRDHKDTKEEIQSRFQKYTIRWHGQDENTVLLLAIIRPLAALYYPFQSIVSFSTEAQVIYTAKLAACGDTVSMFHLTHEWAPVQGLDDIKKDNASIVFEGIYHFYSLSHPTPLEIYAYGLSAYIVQRTRDVKGIWSRCSMPWAKVGMAYIENDESLLLEDEYEKAIVERDQETLCKLAKSPDPIQSRMAPLWIACTTRTQSDFASLIQTDDIWLESVAVTLLEDYPELLKDESALAELAEHNQIIKSALCDLRCHYQGVDVYHRPHNDEAVAQFNQDIVSFIKR